MNRRTGHDIGLVFLVNLLQKVLGFVQMVVIVRLAGVGWYGAWAVVHALAAYLSQIATLGLPNALVRFLPKERAPGQLLCAIVAVVLFASGACMTPMLLWALPLTMLSLKDPRYVGLMHVGAVLVLVNGLRLVVSDYFRARNEMGSWAWVSGGVAAAETIVICGGLAAGATLHAAAGAFAAAGLGGLLATLVAVVHRADCAGFWRGDPLADLRKYVRYSVPLVPSGFASQLATSGDRLLIGAFLGSEAVGLYAASYALGSVVTMLNPPFVTVLFPRLVRAYNAGARVHVDRLVRAGVVSFIGVGGGAGFLVCVASPWLLAAVTGKSVGSAELDVGVRVVCLVAAGTTVFGVARIYSLHLFLAQSTDKVLVCYTTAALVNFGVNLVAIPAIGLVGAGFATLGSYVVLAGLVLLYARRANGGHHDLRGAASAADSE